MRRGSIHVLPLLLVLVVGLVGFMAWGRIKDLPEVKKIMSAPKSGKEPTVTLKEEYQNPFDKEAQYVNPFSDYKNPFDSLK